MIGIVASRLTEKYYRPAVVLTKSSELITGSARSVTGFDIYKAIESCRDLLENFGGHTYAAGLSLKEENLDAFTQRFLKLAADEIIPEQMTPQIDIDAVLDLQDINSKNGTVRGFAERNAINAPIQGSAADIIKIAMVKIYDRFRKEGIRSKMILQVHDELNFSVVPEEKEKVERIVLEEMQNAYPLQVPLVADSGWGKNWLEAH